MRLLLMTVAMTVVSGLASGPAIAQVPPDRLIRFDDGRVRQVGKLRIGREPRLRGAVRAYGPPARKRASNRNGACDMRWRRAGITVIGATFDVPPRRPCDTRRLKLQAIKLSGAGWTTDRGLAIGQPEGRLRELYPAAERVEDVVVLETFEFAFGPTPTLAAAVSRGVVIRFELYVGGAGD